MKNNDIKVCVGLSGGVDSSVAALLLKQQGYDVFALFMQNWNDASTTLHGDCEWEEDRFVAEMVARKIGIPFYFVDLSREYRRRVVDYMFSEYSKGRTPNPDVLCNREIKFDAFLKCAEKLGARMVATGHYCRKEQATGDDGQPLTDAGGFPVYRLLAGTDKNKDQSYFLCQLNQEQLSKALFPIGDITKPEVRRLAREADLPSADKKDSQGICFVGKIDLPTFLQQVLEPKTGNVVEVYDSYYNGNEQYRFCEETLRSIMADNQENHSGSGVTGHFDTGQSGAAASPRPVTGREGTVSGKGRFGMEKIASLTDGQLVRLSEPLRYDIVFETETYRSGKRHVKKTRYKENPFGKIIGQHDGAQFYTVGQRKGLGISAGKHVYVHHIDRENNRVVICGNDELFSREVKADNINFMAIDGISGELRAEAKIRYAHKKAPCTVRMENGIIKCVFDEPQRAATSGQSLVVYDGEYVLCGGTII